MTDESYKQSQDTDEGRDRAFRDQIKHLRVADLAYEMMVSLVTVGYQKLGLTEQTRELRNLDDAHLAIELLRATLDVTEREHDAERFKDLRTTLAQMQLGYVQSLRDEDHERPATGGAPGAGPASADDTVDAASAAGPAEGEAAASSA